MSSAHAIRNIDDRSDRFRRRGRAAKMASVSLVAPYVSMQRPFKSHVYWGRTVDTEMRMELCRIHIQPTNNGINRPQQTLISAKGLPSTLCATLRAARLRELRNLGIIIHITPSTSTIKAPWLAPRLRKQTSIPPQMIQPLT